jgi:hypothetical protein
MRQMLRNVSTGEITAATPSARRLDGYELVDVEMHPMLYRTDASGRRFDRFGNCLDVAKPEAVDAEFEEVSVPPKRQRGRIKMAIAAEQKAADAEINDLMEGLG